MKTAEQCEEILDTAANTLMDQWDITAFKKTHRKLFDTVIAAMQVASAPDAKTLCAEEETGEHRCQEQCLNCDAFSQLVGDTEPTYDQLKQISDKHYGRE